MALDSKSGSRKINQNVDLAPGARNLTTTGNITAGAFYGDGSHLTGISTASANDALITITAGAGLTGGGGFTVDQATDAIITVSHSDTSAQASIANTAFNVIQSITLDTYGHITAIESKDIGTAGFYVKTTGETGTGVKIGLGGLTYQTVQFFAGTGLSVVRTDNEIQFSAPNAANWDTAYGWGDHANNLYLPLTGKAADSELIDGFDSTALYRQVYADNYGASPTSRWYVVTLPYSGGSGWSDYFYFDVLAYRDIGNLQSQLHYRVYLHNRGISANNNQLNASVVTELEQPLEFAEFGYKSGVASSSQFFIKLGEDYSGISIVAYPGENTITASMIAAQDTAPTGFTAVTPTKYAKDTINLQDVTSNGDTTNNSITALSFVKSGGTSSQFLKADGTVDSNSYLTTTAKAADSNLLDGIDSASFFRSDADDTASGAYTFTGKLKLTQTAATIGGTTVANASILVGDTTTGIGIDNNEIHSTGVLYIGTNTGNLVLRPTGSVVDAAGNRFLTTADEGSGNGLDADTLDGNHASAFLQNSGEVTHSGLISFTGTGSTSGIRFNSATVANDAFGIRVNGTSNAGELEFYSTDDDTEPFVFRHYTTGQDGTGSSVEWARINNDFMSHQSDMRAPIFYDLNNTGYYVDPAGRSNFTQIAIQGTSYYFDRNTSYFRWQSPSGYIDIGSGNTTWAHFYTDRPGFYFGPSNVAFDGNIFGYGGDETASFATYYDSNNTAYYVDPASTSYLNEISGPYFKHITLPSVGLGNSYDERVLLLIPKVETNNSYNNRIHGKVILGKTGGNVIDFFDIQIQSVYNATYASFTSTGQRNDHKFVTCTYNGIKWVAIKVSFTANPYNYAYFHGHAITDFSSASPDMLRLVSYYDTNGGGVLNSEIYNSIVDYTPSPMPTKISNGGAGLIVEGPTYSDIFYDKQNTSYYLDPANTSRMGAIERLSHSTGHQIGSYNSVGGNSAYSNPIYTIGNNYNPSDSSLGPMYGIGYAHPNFSGWGSGKTSSWGLYIANNGSIDATIGEGSTTAWFKNSVISGADFRAPIFYDSNNTSYYVDPSSTTWSSYNLGGARFRNIQISSSDLTDTIQSVNAGGNLWLQYGHNGPVGLGYGGGLTTVYNGLTVNSGLSRLSGGIRLQDTNGAINSMWGIYGWDTQLQFTKRNISTDGYEGTAMFIDYGGLYVQSDYSFRAPIFYDSNDTGYYVDPASTARLNLVIPNYLRRAAHNTGHLEGGYNNIGGSGTYTNPIFTIGSSYNPAATTLSNMYGIGYTGTASSFINFTGQTDWGLYVAADGDARVWLDGSSGNISSKGNVYASIFYDSDDTNYYVNPTGTSSLYNMQGYFHSFPYREWDFTWGSHGANNSMPSMSFAMWDNYTQPSAPSSYGTVLDFYGLSGHQHDQLYFAQGSIQHRYGWYGNNTWSAWREIYTSANGSMQTPILYDSNNTGYYLDPASTSNLYEVIANRIECGYNHNVSNSIGCSDWFRSSGSTGWYNGSYSGGIYMTDTSWVRVYNSKAFYVANQIAATGDITAYYSDERLKNKKGSIENPIKKVQSLNAFYYTNNELAKENGYTDEKLQIGLSAQEVQAVMPEIVSLAPFDMETDEFEEGKVYSKSGENYLTVNYAKLVPLLIEAIKEQQNQIEELKAIVDGLTK